MLQRPIVLLMIPHLGGGGAERVTALLMSGLDPGRFEVHICVVTQRDATGYEIPGWVTVHGIGARRVRWGAWSLLGLVRRLEPDLILTGMAHLNLLMLLLRPLFPRKTRLIVRQNGSLLAAHGRSWYRLLYPRADAVVCQSDAMAIEVHESTGMKGHLHVLPNPVDVVQIRGSVLDAPDRWSGPGPHLLAIGRLAPEKGFDLLLAAFAGLRARFPAADLSILGDGRDRVMLEFLARLLGSGAAVRFAGEVAHPEAWFAGATLFVLASRREALPNALLEAAAGGLPIVATPASRGLIDLVEGEPGVWLAAEVSAEGIEAALLSALENLEPGQRFAHPWVEPFGKERAIAAYEALIEAQLAGAAR
jgi:glycosyltransferase involved in cell wall biosynthesis